MIEWRHWLWPTRFDVSCFCTYQPDLNYWTGKSSTDVTLKRIDMILYVEEEPARWGASIVYEWPGSPGWGWEFELEPLGDRPYISGLAEEIAIVPVYRETSCVMREVPT